MACLVCLCVALGTLSGQQKRFRPSPEYGQLGAPDQAEGRRILEEFRTKGISGEYYLEFQLRVMPRRGAERLVPGRLWGARNDRGPISRLALFPGSKSSEQRLLVQNGPRNAAWSWSAASSTSGVQSVGAAALFRPLADTDLTPFDLQMPFLYWNDFVFEGVVKVRGRPAHAFLLYPTDEVIAQKPELTGVRVYLDTQYGALVQAELIGAENRPLKAITVLELKKVGEQWIVKAIDLRDETTRNKTRFSVTGAALGMDFAASLFEPATLADAVRPPTADRIVPVAP